MLRLALCLLLCLPLLANEADANALRKGGAVGNGQVTCTTGGYTVPAIAASIGYNCLVFNQDSTTGFDLSTDETGNHKWYVGQWQGNYGTDPSRATYSGGLVTLDWLASISIPAGCPIGGYQPTRPCPIPLIGTLSVDNQRGTAFGHGYFEIVSTITGYAGTPPVAQPSSAPGAYAAFWLLGQQTGLQCIAGGYQNGGSIASPAPPYSELDILQTQTSVNPNGSWQSYNYGPAVPGCGSSFGSPQATFNTNIGQVPGGVDWTQPHTSAMTWTNGRLEWYIDNVAYFIASTTPATENQLHGLYAWMAEGCSFSANNASCLGSVTEFRHVITSIRVWSCTSQSGQAMMSC